MLANRRGLMPKYLHAISVKSNELTATPTTTTPHSNNNQQQQQQQQQLDLICNFKDLLAFWQKHYLQRDKDFSGLEQNSKIEFAYWKSTVERLLEPSSQHPCSLNFYLNNELATCTAKKSPLDVSRPD